MTFELLRGLAADEADRVLEQGVRQIVPGGTALFRLGERADRLFLTTRGCLRLTLPLEIRGHEENILTEEISAGQTVGWSAMIPPYLFTLTAIAPSEAEVIALPRQALQEYFAAHPATGYTISQNLSAVIGHRLHLFQTMWLREMQRAIEVHSV